MVNQNTMTTKGSRVKPDLNKDDLWSAAQLFGWALTLWTVGATVVAILGHARMQGVLEEDHVAGAYWIVVTSLALLALINIYGRISDSRIALIVGGLYGALWCVVDASLVIPVLLAQNAGIEITNWGLNFLLFMLSAVVNSRRKKPPKKAATVIDDDDK